MWLNAVVLFLYFSAFVTSVSCLQASCNDNDIHNDNDNGSLSFFLASF